MNSRFSFPPLSTLSLGICALGAALISFANAYWHFIAPAPFAMEQGLLVATIALNGILLVHLFPRWQWGIATAVLTLLTPMALLGFWYSYGQWGISDWDYYFSLHETIRRTLFQYHTFPWWNPFICGGTAGLGDPEFSLFTPSFLLELIFGVPNGLRLAIYLVTATGAAGMLWLAKRLKLSVTAGLIAGIAFAFGSVNLLEVVEGHPNIFAAGWLPWVWWAWLGAYRRRTWQHTLLCGVFLALTFLQGGIYLLMYTALAFLIIPWLTTSPKKAYLTTVQAGAWALGLAGIKLVPVLLWLSEFQDEMYASSASTFRHLHQIFLGRYLHDSEVFFNQGSAWHEYGAYIGFGVLLLAIAGLVTLRANRIVRGLLVGTVLATVVSSTGPLLKPFFDHASFFPRSNISRIVLYAVIPLSLLAGFGYDFLANQPKRWSRWFATLLVTLMCFELFTLAYGLSEQAFVLPAVVPAVSPAPSPIAYTALKYQYRSDDDDYNRAYAATLAGYGTMSYCSVLTPPRAVRTIHDESDNGIISLADHQGTYRLVSWNPNRVEVDVTLTQASDVILNANYAKGWLVNGVPAQEIADRVGHHGTPGTTHLIFEYHLPGFVVGVLLSLLTGGGILLSFIFPKWWRGSGRWK